MFESAVAALPEGGGDHRREADRVGDRERRALVRDEPHDRRIDPRRRAERARPDVEQPLDPAVDREHHRQPAVGLVLRALPHHAGVQHDDVGCFGSRGGLQRPAFKVDLRGQGELVLTDLATATGRLVVMSSAR